MTDYDAQPSKPFPHSGAARPPKATRPIIAKDEPATPSDEHKVAAVVGLAGARDALHKAKAENRASVPSPTHPETPQ